jgi:hypothetical protein
MRFRSALFASLLLVGACTPAPAPTPDVLQSKVQGTLNQVMRGILFPNSNVIFDAQDKNPGAEVDPNDPTDSVHVFHSTYGGWESVENAAMALAEAANLVALPGRTCANGKPVPLNDPEFQKGLAGLRDVALASYKAAQSKDMGAMLDIADKLTNACAACHDIYRDRIVNEKPIGIADRCVK